MLKFKDPSTGLEAEATPSRWRSESGEPYTMGGSSPHFNPDKIDTACFSLWRYRDLLQLNVTEAGWRRTQMGEGATALVSVESLGEGLQLKMDFAMPTLSFKDRGVAVMLAQAAEWGVAEVVVDSSGNAATSVAAYAARLDMRAHVFVPDSTSDAKLRQIQAHGATVHKIPGSREDTGAATHAYLQGSNAFYASHIYNPLFHQGTKTMVFELWEQMGGRLPNTLFLPVGNGTMLIGAIIGLKEILSAGLAEHMPKIIAVQSAACAPIARALESGETEVTPIENAVTIAEGIAIGAPARGGEILGSLRSVSAHIITVTDDEVRSAQSMLAAAGFFVEPTAAVCMAAYSKTPCEGVSVVPLCGAGLKSAK